MRFPLSALADVRLGYPFRTRVTPDPQGETALVQLADLNGGVLDTSALVRVHLKKIREHFALRPGDILFRARSQAHDATYVDDLALSPGVVRVVAAAPIMVVRVRPPAGRTAEGLPDGVTALDARYLHWLLNHPQTQAVLRARNTGHNAEVLRKGDLEGLPLPVPSPAVQHLIIEAAGLLERERRLRRQLLEERFAMIQRQLLRHADTEGTETARTTPASPPAEERSEGQTWARLEGI
ncbi:hypothetical protein [uncultured Desulfovibrio sp.]|uniref:hypothetical protein n=2 Tax=uncultured Desulfovibrio sp. TaxID=167968 RepID=UPI0025F80C1D|nr:hypothetical protein [uncultured Desulfovibrio sp.]